MSPPVPRPSPWLRAAGLFLLIWGVQIAVVARYGSDVPQWDQWDAEGAYLYVPYHDGALTWQALIAPHNEHRIMCTRLLALGLLRLNGQWDARLECVANAGLHAAIGVLCFLWGAARLERRWHAVWLAAILVATALPFAMENVLGGFNSQQYFLVGFSVAAIACLGAAPAHSARWWTGVACALLAIFSMASGLLAVVAIGGVGALAIRTRADIRRHAATLAACAVVLTLGLLLNHHAAYHDSLRAGSVGEFLAAFRRYVGWEFERMGWYRDLRMAMLPPLVWIPCGWLGWRLVRRPAEVPQAERVVLAVGVWSLLQFAASAYARGAGAPWPATRYLDNLLVGLAANVLALLFIVQRVGPNPAPSRRWLIGAAITGFVFSAAGLTVHLHYAMTTGLPESRAHLAVAAENTRRFLQENDPADLRRGEIPYPDPGRLAELLHEPGIRAILPVSLQPPGVVMGPLSRAAQIAADNGLAIAAAGAGLLASAWWWLKRNAAGPESPARPA